MDSFYYQLFEQGTTPLLVIDKFSSAIKEINLKGRELLGLESVSSLPLLSSFIENHSKLQFDNFLLKHPDKFKTFISTMKLENESTIYAEFKVQPVSWKDDKRLLVSIRDVTREVHDKEKFIDSNRKYLELYNNSITGLYRATLNYTILECNEAFLQIFQFEHKKEAIGASIETYFMDIDPRSTTVNTSRLGNVNCHETKIKLPNGDIIWILENIRIITDKENKPVFIEGSVIDITERVKFQQKLAKQKKYNALLESKLISSQLNPHFLFNALNSFQYHILNNNEEESLGYIEQFSLLVRKLLENSTKEFIPLIDEVAFLESFVKISKSRNFDKFDYQINISEELLDSDIVIPPMIIQPFVENAIIHGFNRKNGKGKLTIQFHIKDKNLICEVIDNGVGRKVSSQNKLLTSGKNSLGTNLVERRLEILQEYYQFNFEFEIEDLFDEKALPKGTKVSLKFDLIYEEFED